VSEAKKRVEFGDFQTPFDASVRVCEVLKELGLAPKVVIEPTCGRGSFLVASIQTFGSTLVKAMGFDINSTHIKSRKKLFQRPTLSSISQLLFALRRKVFLIKTGVLFYEICQNRYYLLAILRGLLIRFLANLRVRIYPQRVIHLD